MPIVRSGTTLNQINCRGLSQRVVSMLAPTSQSTISTLAPHINNDNKYGWAILPEYILLHKIGALY